MTNTKPPATEQDEMTADELEAQAKQFAAKATAKRRVGLEGKEKEYFRLQDEIRKVEPSFDSAASKNHVNILRTMLENEAMTVPALVKAIAAIPEYADLKKPMTAKVIEAELQTWSKEQTIGSGENARKLKARFAYNEDDETWSYISG